MDDRYQIRQANPADLEWVGALERAAFTDPWSESLLRDALAEGASVVECEGAIVAYTFFRRAGSEGEILNIAVAPEHRRKGIARTLLEATLTEFVRAGVDKVFLEVRESNEEARGFYQKLGFHPIGRRSRYYRNPPEAALVLVRHLAPLQGSA